MSRAASLLLVLLPVALWAAPGWAFAPDPESVYSSGRTTIRATATNPNWNPVASGNDWRLQRSFEMAAPAGKKVNAKAYITVPKAGASGARRFMAKALKAVPLLGTGILLWELWDDYGVRRTVDGEGLEADPGVPPTNQTVACWRTASMPAGMCKATAGDAAQWQCDYSYPGPNPKCVSYFLTGTTGTFSWAGYTWCDGAGCGTMHTTSAFTTQINNTPTSQPRCADGSAPTRKDGKCATGVYSPITEEQAETLVQTYPPPSAEELAALADALNWSPFPIPDEKPYATDVPNVGNTVQLTTPAGTTTTTETYSPDTSTAGQVDWNKTTTTTKPDGTTETETGEKPKPLDPCGLPTTPPCAIDEKETPKSDSLTNATKAVEDATKARQDGLTTVTSPTGKNTSWAWNLALPATCVPLNVDMRVGSIGRLVTINPCNWMTVIHDLVSMLWAGGTLFAVFGMVGRTLREA